MGQVDQTGDADGTDGVAGSKAVDVEDGVATGAVADAEEGGEDAVLFDRLSHPAVAAIVVAAIGPHQRAARR